MRNRGKHSEQHNIPVEIIKELPNALRTPIMIYKGNHEGSVVILTDYLNQNNENIIVPIDLSVKGSQGKVNRVTTIYGKKNIESYISEVIMFDKILAINKEKADQMHLDKGIQSSQSTAVICFDKNIAYSLDNVKYV